MTFTAISGLTRIVLFLFDTVIILAAMAYSGSKSAAIFFCRLFPLSPLINLIYNKVYVMLFILYIKRTIRYD
ncbi:hypothetical protein BSR42_08040 [Megasphaera cerevisiae]|nr:hypothetical protein BSR42_08040 [Megasphaera cerevisiae]